MSEKTELLIRSVEDFLAHVSGGRITGRCGGSRGEIDTREATMFIHTRFQLSGGKPSRPPVRARPPRRRPLRAIPSSATATPELGTPAFRVWSLWLGHRLAEEGAAALGGHLERFAAVARGLGVEPERARLIADPAASDVARSRAFFAVAMALDELEPEAHRRSPEDGPVAA